MAFFRNTTVNLLNLHYVIRAIAQSGGGAFVAAYLIKAGVPVAAALTALALMLAVRFIVRPLLVGVTMRWGMRAMVIIGSALSALQFPIVAEVHGVGIALAAYVVATAIGDALYWTAYHAYFAALGDHAHRGHQLGARQALAAVIGIASPVLSGWMLVGIGPRAAFDASALMCIISILPLLWTANVAVQERVPGAIKAAKFGIKQFIADGVINAGNVFAWQIALFVSLKQSFVAFGGALAAAALVGAVASLVLGRYIDRGYGRRAVWLAFGTLACVIVLRVISIGNAPLAILANALGAVSGALYIPTAMTAIYNEAKRAICTLRFHVACESAWDIGGGAGLLAAAALIAFGAPLGAGVALSMIGAGASFSLMYQYYGRAEIPVDPAVPNLAPRSETGSAAT